MSATFPRIKYFLHLMNIIFSFSCDNKNLLHYWKTVCPTVVYLILTYKDLIYVGFNVKPLFNFNPDFSLKDKIQILQEFIVYLDIIFEFFTDRKERVNTHVKTIADV